MSSTHWTVQKIVLNIFYRCDAVRTSLRNNTVSNLKVVIKGAIVASKARVINRIKTITYIIQEITRCDVKKIMLKITKGELKPGNKIDSLSMLELSQVSENANQSNPCKLAKTEISQNLSSTLRLLAFK